ncbi:MAG: nitroreductase family protein, partial [Lachnospiraceae bacterium]|nr:nitroreductase family protein [Lachnospiraceae bacterium]
MEFEEILKRRRSVRRFTDQQVREETIIQIMNEARHAPTWANAQETR